MAMKLPRLCLLLLLLLLNLSWAQGIQLSCQQSDYSCDKCIEAGPDCAWCSSPNVAVHCHTLEEVQKAGCTDVYSPQSSIEILRNESSPAQITTMFMQPQELSIRLRPGRTQTIQLNVFMPADQQTTQVDLEAINTPSGMNFALKSNISGNSGLIEVSVNAAQCPSRNQNMTGPWFVYVVAQDSPQRVTLAIHLECHCNCSLNREKKSAACSSRGTHVCGHCECYRHYIGESCQIEDDPYRHLGDASCKSNSNAPLCSGRGICVDSECWCDYRINPRERYSGQYCQCSNFDCPYHNDRVCGGNGRCSCGKCICDAGWVGKACDCSTDLTPCMARNGQICNGRGTCDCGVCRCTSIRFMGPTCEICPLCPGTCSKYMACVECRAFGMGEMASRCDAECNYFSMTMVQTVDHLPDVYTEIPTVHCKERGDDGCAFYYTVQATTSVKNVTVARKKDCPKTIQWWNIG